MKYEKQTNKHLCLHVHLIIFSIILYRIKSVELAQFTLYAGSPISSFSLCKWSCTCIILSGFPLSRRCLLICPISLKHWCIPYKQVAYTFIRETVRKLACCTFFFFKKNNEEVSRVIGDV